MPLPIDTPVTAAAIDDLRGRVAGQVVTPGDAGYDTARAAWKLTVDQHPKLIVMAANAGDIAAAVRFAAGHGLDIALQATGHGVILPADGALLINTAGMTGVAIDPAAQTARVSAGAPWSRVLAAAQAHGLAPLLGSSPGVGAVGYTLGGGFGWLGRKFGLASDSALAFEVVTTAGQALTASATENPDLFWGLRGGGGSLAVVTAMTIRLYAVSTVYGGFLHYPGHLATAAVRRWRDWVAAAPDELTSSIKIMNLPDLPFIPPPLRGQTIVNVAGCYCGPVAEGEALLQPWREWQQPLMDTFRPMPFTEVGDISQDPADPTPGFTSGAWLRWLDDETIDTLVRFATLQEGHVPLIFTEVRHAGGAMARPTDTAFGHRADAFLLDVVGLVAAPPLRGALAAYFESMKTALGPALSGAVYMNFLEGPEAAAQVCHGFTPETFARLATLKAQYDPTNRLNRGMAIPAGA